MGKIMKTINTYINEKLRLTSKPQYTCQPKNKDELLNIIIDRIENEGNECDLNDIDVSKITSMTFLFDVGENKIFKNFNGDVSMWNVSNVENMDGMFDGCEKFKCDLSMWDVSNVESMAFTFRGCKKFNCDISKWNVSKVKDMFGMFYRCKKFNCDLSKWDVSNVKEMNHEFEGCPTTPTWYDKDRWE